MVGLVRRLSRLFILAILLLAATLANAAPATTTIRDTVYRADGSPASGTLLISWPAFTTAGNEAVASGNMSITLGAQGALTVDLVPNAGATPSDTRYRIVYKLDDGSTTVENWSVGSNSPTTIAAVRTNITSGTTTAQFASKQYVDTAIAANKAYVDTALASVGSGSYVSKTGDTMSGPLTLPSDPTAPSQAATRHYVDLGLASKAALMAGLVPVDELASGTADATRCLKGDQTWGACGTSSDAVSLQGVPLALATPSDGQVPTYESASNSYKPKAPTGLTSGMQAIKYASDLNWSAKPSADLSAAGAKTASLTSCPPGVRGSEPEYWIYISGTGTSEAVKVTGGTCAGDNNAGTLQFTTANAHPAGYSLGSASSGLQEALISARITPTNPTGTPQAGKIIVPPGEYKLYARVSLRSSMQTVDFTGSILECYMDDTCLFVGDPASSNSFSDVTLINPRGRPMVVNGTKPFLEINSQKTRIENIMLRVPPTGATFGSIVQVDDDQAFHLDGMEGTIGVRCDATFCGNFISAPGPFNTWSAVGWLTNLNISPQCKGNGVLWRSGNTLRISDSVVQGYAQFGLRTGRDRGGYGNTRLENVYMETGNCSNPVFNRPASAGVITNGGTLTVTGGEGPQGAMPCFTGSSCTGSPTDLRYWIVATKSGAFSNLLYAGRADSTGSGTIQVVWPPVATATSYDLLVATATGQAANAPFGSGTFAVATNIPTSACSAGVCSYNDTQGARLSYTVSAPSYYPMLDFWPGDVTLGSQGSDTDLLSASILETDHGFSVVNSELGTRAPAMFSSYCSGVGVSSPLWRACLNSSLPPQTWYEQGATILAVKATQDGGQSQNLKGRFNFSTLGSGPGHIVTLYDSNFAKTVAHRFNRPTNDAGDMFIGYDNVSTAPDQYSLTFGAPKAISSYINNNGDGANWKERLTSSLKEFKTDVKINGNLTVTGTCTGCGSGGGTNASAPSGTDGQLVMIDGANGFKVLTNLSWDGTRFHIPGSAQVDGRLTVVGPLETETDVPVSAPILSSSAKFKMAVDTDGRLKGSYNGSAFSRYLFDTDSISYSQISNPPSPYALPVATSSVLGGVKGGTCAAGTLQRGFQADGSPNCASMSHDHSDATNGGQLDSTAILVANKQGTGAKFSMATGAFTSSNYRSSDSNGNEVDAGVTAGPYSIPWITFRRASATSVGVIASSNKAAWWGIVLTFPVTTTQITYEVGTADNTANSYDIGVYDSQGNLKAHIGPTPGTTFAPSTGIKTLNWLAPVTLQPGRYYLAYTSSCTTGGASCAQLAGGNGDGVTFLSMAWMAVASGGTLNGPLTPPADTWSFQSSLPAWAIR